PTRQMIEQEREQTNASDQDSSGAYLDHLYLIERNGKQLLKHVNDLLEVSRIDAGCSRLQYSNVNIALILKKIASNFENWAKERNIDYRVDAPDHLVAEVDPHAHERVLMNLLSNAVKFTPEHG